MTDPIASGYWNAVSEQARTVASHNLTKDLLYRACLDNDRIKQLAASLEERLTIAEADADRLARAITAGHPAAQYTAIDAHIEALGTRQ